MNKVQLCGRLTKDPEVRYTDGDNPKTVARYVLAIDRRKRKGQDPQADFIPIKAFNKSGDFAEKYFKKGMRVIVTGRIHSFSYVNKDGAKVYGLEVVADEQEFADGKRSNEVENSNSGYEAGGANISHDDGIGDGFMNIPIDAEDELPFN